MVRENKTLEFKEAVSNSFLKTVSAYSNFGTGVIQFGIKDDGSVSGIHDVFKASLDIENKINDSISPKPDFTIHIDEQSKTIMVTVFEGSAKPYMYKGKAYRRSDTSTVAVDSIELRRLALEGQNLTYDELPVKETDLTFNKLASYIEHVMKLSPLTTDILRTLQLIDIDGAYTVAGALLADKNKFFGIDIAKFGESIDIISDREMLSGLSILEQYDRAVEKFKQYYQYDIIDGIQRRTVSLIPENAFREAVANALIHRQWDEQITTRIAMHPDKIIIYSPGGLPRGMTEDVFRSGYFSKLRNPIIANVFYRLQLIEMFGTGIHRIIESYRGRVRQPSFIIQDNVIVLELPVESKNTVGGTNGAKIVKLLDAYETLTANEISNLSNISRATVSRILKQLVENKLVLVEGKARSTRYRKNTL